MVTNVCENSLLIARGICFSFLFDIWEIGFEFVIPVVLFSVSLIFKKFAFEVMEMMNPYALLERFNLVR